MAAILFVHYKTFYISYSYQAETYTYSVSLYQNVCQGLYY